jgi:hypothetical protein
MGQALKFLSFCSPAGISSTADLFPADGKRQALLALSFVQVLYEFEDVSFAEFPARF